MIMSKGSQFDEFAENKNFELFRAGRGGANECCVFAQFSSKRLIYMKKKIFCNRKIVPAYDDTQARTHKEEI